MKPARFSLFPNIALPVFLAALGFSTTVQAWWDADYTIRKKITVDTSSNGAGIADPIGTTAVLIRLHDGDFQFSSAKDDGSDIRLVAADDKTPLVYHVEKYDSLLGEAFLWVKLPDLKPGAPTSFYLYYGDNGTKVAPGAPDANATYDSDQVLVYHFSEGAQPVRDFTSYANTSQAAGLTTDGSLIGPGLRLDGKTTVTIPTSESLTWADGAALTWSAWVKPAALQANAVIFSRRDGAKDFVVGMDNGVPFVDLNGSRSGTGAPVAANSWHHLAVIVNGAQATLYLDGASYATAGSGLSALNVPSVIGGDPSGTGMTGFTGEMDELEISRVARPARRDQAGGRRPGRRQRGQAPCARPGRVAAGELAQRQPRPFRRHPQVGHHRRLGRHRRPGGHVGDQLVGDDRQIFLPAKSREGQPDLPQGVEPYRTRPHRPRLRRQGEGPGDGRPRGSESAKAVSPGAALPDLSHWRG